MADPDFEQTLNALKAWLPAEIESSEFKYADIIGILVLFLQNSDVVSSNKSSDKNSNQSDIRLTGPSDSSNDISKIGFFPSLSPETAFEGRRLRVSCKYHGINVNQLLSGHGHTADRESKWFDSHLTLRRKKGINDTENPVLLVGYENDLEDLRENLKIGDYLVIVKRKTVRVMKVSEY